MTRCLQDVGLAVQTPISARHVSTVCYPLSTAEILGSAMNMMDSADVHLDSVGKTA